MFINMLTLHLLNVATCNMFHHKIQIVKFVPILNICDYPYRILYIFVVTSTMRFQKKEGYNCVLPELPTSRITSLYKGDFTIIKACSSSAGFWEWLVLLVRRCRLVSVRFSCRAYSVTGVC